MSDKYEVEHMEFDEEEEDDATWDATDWCYIVRAGNDHICICATQEEADRICRLLNADT